MANMQYGFDLAAVGSLQAMPGFLKVFGYPDSSSDTGYGIDVSLLQRSNATFEQHIYIYELTTSPL